MNLENIIEEVKQMNAPQFETLVRAMAGIAKETYECGEDPAWREAQFDLVRAANTIAKRRGD